MKILVIGSGGREHALVWKLAQSATTTQLWCAPWERRNRWGKARCKRQASREYRYWRRRPVRATGFCRSKSTRPHGRRARQPAFHGSGGSFQAHGFTIWGPNQKAAQFEASKAFSQTFMETYGIPTARSGFFSEVGAAREFARSLGGCCAVKADGLALGKGVLITSNEEEADRAIEQVMVDKSFGDAGKQVVIQEKLEGLEVSLHALCDGSRYLLFDTSQDHKRAMDGDLGLNTGGMGTYSPAPFLTGAQLKQIQIEVMDRWLAGCKQEAIDFRGMLYPGIMLTQDGPKVLEFNARFGDPETQVYLMRLKNDLPELLMASASGNLQGHELRWDERAATCVVMASGGYPEAYPKGKVIHGLPQVADLEDVHVFHAGTARDDSGAWVTSGGRVLGVTALGADLQKATQKAYLAVEKIHFDGHHFRRDIAAKAL